MMHLPDTQRELRRRHAKVLERDPSLLNLPVPIPSVPVLSPILDPILSPLVAGTTPQSTAPADQSPSPSGVSSEDSSPSSTARATSSSPPPPLISLPIPLPSIPILSPLLSPLIGGSEPSSSAQAQDTPTPITTQGAPIPIATQIPSIPGLSGNSGGDQSGSEGSSGGGSGDGSAGGDSNNGAGASNGVGTDSGDGDSGDTGDGGGFSPASPSEGPGAHSSNTPGVSGGSHGPHGGPSTSSPFRPTSIANTPGNISSAVAGSGTTGVPSSASGESASSLGASETSSGFEPVANVHDGAVVSTTSSGGSTSGTVSYRSGRPVATGTLTSSGVRPGSSATSNTSGPGVDGNGSPSQLPSSADSKHGLPKGVLAVVIAIAVLLSLGLLVCCVRKRAVAKRKSSRKWFFGGAGQVYGNPAISSSQYFRDHPSSTRTDSALSFGTPIDQGTMREVSPSEAMLPTLALKSSEQFWQETPNDPILAPSAAFISDNDPSPLIRSPGPSTWRHSGGSNSSGESVAQISLSQYLLVPDATRSEPSSADCPSPMSVRPFSPSESWTFPKPPGTLTSSARSNTATLRSARSYIETNSDYATAPENPFADFVDDQSLDHPSSLLSVSVDSHFATVETICRPFVPTMSDEMSTAPGERVRMLQRFSDGWAYAEKVETGSRGLIPIDCLRTTDEDLPAFLASKRLSSYRGLNPSLSADGGRVTEFGQSKR